MDARTFIERLTLKLTETIQQFEIHIESDNCPKSLHFFVLSEEFKDVSRGSRINILLKATSEILGVPMLMMAFGVCLTYAEYDQYRNEQDIDDEQNVVDRLTDGNAVLPFSL